MDYEVQISREAQIELDVAECFFRAKNLNEALLVDFFIQIGFLVTNPEAFQIKFRDVSDAMFRAV